MSEIGSKRRKMLMESGDDDDDFSSSGPLNMDSIGEEHASQDTMTTSSNPIEEDRDDIDLTGGVEGGDFNPSSRIPAMPSSGSLTLADALNSKDGDVTRRTPPPPQLHDPHNNPLIEKIFSSFPCQVIPETLGRMTRTPPDGEQLEVYKNNNGRLRIFVIDHWKKFSFYSNQTHKLCAVCNRTLRGGEMHLNFPADLDRRRIWANLLGFKYKDILRSKMGPVSCSIASGPICTEHFAEECFRNHNFNKAAIEAFGVPVAISPDVKTTPSKKRVPWVCTICDFHSCSVVELQTHLLEHTEAMMKDKDAIMDVPDAGFMCPFCRKCTYGYKTISGYRRHLNAGPIHHCHLRRIYEFAKMNCRATELDPVDSWSNWTRRNVYVAYHGCEPPANEIVLTPSPTKRAYANNPEERTRLVHDEERRKKACRSLSFVGKEGGTSVNDLNVMQRQVYLQIRREEEHTKKHQEREAEAEKKKEKEKSVEENVEVNVVGEEEEEEEEEDDDIQEIFSDSPAQPMGSSSDKRRSATSNKTAPLPKESPSAAKKRKRSAAKEEPEAPPVKEEVEEEEEEEEPADPNEKLRRRIRDKQFAEMVQKRSQQVKRLMDAKKFKGSDLSPRKARKALPFSPQKHKADLADLDDLTSISTPRDQSPEPSTSGPPIRAESPKPSTSGPPQKTPKTVSIVEPLPTARSTRSSTRSATAAKPSPVPASKPKGGRKPAQHVAQVKNETMSPEERPLKSVLARSFTAGVRPSFAHYQFKGGSSHSPKTDPIRGHHGGGSPSQGPSGPGSFTKRVLEASAIEEEEEGGDGKVGSSTVTSSGQGHPAKRATPMTRRPLILSPRKKAASSTPPVVTIHDSTPPPPPLDTRTIQLIPENSIQIDNIEEVVQDDIMTLRDTGVTSSSTMDLRPPRTIAEALLEETVHTNAQDCEEISRKMTEEASYFRAMDDVIKGRTVTKMRADMRLSRQCMRQIEAAQARVRLFGNAPEGEYEIIYSNDGAQVIPKKDPKIQEIQQQGGPSNQ